MSDFVDFLYWYLGIGFCLCYAMCMVCTVVDKEFAEKLTMKKLVAFIFGMTFWWPVYMFAFFSYMNAKEGDED